MFQFLDFNVLGESEIMLSDGSLRVSKDCYLPSPTSESASSTKFAARKGKSRASLHHRADVKLKVKPKMYMGFLLRFIRDQLFIRNTKDTIVEDYSVPQVMKRQF